MDLHANALVHKCFRGIDVCVCVGGVRGPFAGSHEEKKSKKLHSINCVIMDIKSRHKGQVYAN